ncbi:hypothetical protein B0H14DRAFT_2812040 [Mycena olivaceomarginata]|nr:hypothetical protein B0H14DRAFT_2812040 [Mycena olivaceomarginata]
MAFGGGAARDDGVGADDFARNFGDAGDDAGEAGYDAYEEGEGNSEDLYYGRDVRGRPAGLVPRAVCVSGRPPRPRMARKEKGTAGVAPGGAVARDRDPPLILPDVGLLGRERHGRGATDAGTVWGELWAAAASAAAPAAGANATPAPPPERRALVPDSYIVLVERLRQLEDEEEKARLAAAGGAGSPDSSEEGEYEDAQAGDERGQLVQ